MQVRISTLYFKISSNPAACCYRDTAASYIADNMSIHIETAAM